VPRQPDDPLLAEGWPVLPWPQGPGFLKEGKVLPATLLEDAPRIEAAFRRYIRRDIDHKRVALKEKALAQLSDGFVPDAPSSTPIDASPSKEEEHEFVIIVCHMNVIRYLVARALQIPPETWLRMRGNNCGLTEIIIKPNGQVSLGTFGDVGHLAIEQVTFH